MKKIIVLLLVLFIILAAAFFTAYNWYNSAVFGTTENTQEISFLVEEGDTLVGILPKLEDSGIIKSAFAAQIYIQLSNIEPKIKVGEYTIQNGLPLPEVISALEKGALLPTITVTLREGWRYEQMASELEKTLAGKTKFVPAEFVNIVESPDNYSFSDTVSTFLTLHKPATKPLRGFLYPDTYKFQQGMTTLEIVDFILQNTVQKFNSALPNGASPQNQSNFGTLYEAITLASIIEREASSWDDRKDISSVFHNRLALGMALEADSTVNFITGKNDPGVSIQDLQIDSPYNTYKYPGLPPTPINNPRIESIVAALQPNITDYFYFYHTPNGQTYFNTNFQDHYYGVCRDLGC